MRTASLVLTPLALALACAQVIGIDDASVDPRLAGEATGGTSTAGTSTGGVATGGSGIGGTDMGGQGPAGAAGEGSTPEASVCETYCDQITEYCTGDLQQYRDRAQCLKICSFLPEGELAGADANTATCRLKYAGKARYASGTELAAYCRQAGPGGDGRCGSNCEGYCSVMMRVCTEDSADVYHFEQAAQCIAACEQLPQSDIAYSTSDPLVSDGNHVQCRLFHVTSAAMLDTEEHCEHAVGVTLCSTEAE